MTLVQVQDQSSIELMPQAWALAERIARTEFVPTALRGKPEAVLAAILTGHEVGISPMQALSKIHVIEGRPAMAAELMRALVLAQGHEFYVEESNTTRCTVVVRRHGAERESRFTWTLDDAKRAGLDGRQNWKRYTRAMLLARATSEAIRAVFPDVVAGISYSVEELTDGDVIDLDDVDAARAPAPAAPKGPTAQARRAATAPAAPRRRAPAAPPAASPAPPLPGEDGFDELAATEPSPVTGDGAPEESDAVGAADSSPPSDTDEGTLPLTQRVAMWCVEAQETLGLKPSDEWRHRFLAAFSGGAYASATDVPAADVEELREKLNQVRTGQLVIGERDAVPMLLWSARDHEQNDDGDAAEIIDFDWWMRRIADVSGVGQNTLLKKARALAEEFEVEVPSAVEEITEPALVAAVEQWLDAKAAGE